MIKTNEHNVSFNDLTVDTAGLQALTHAGIKTATEIGVAAGAKIYVGRRVLWNVAKIRKAGCRQKTSRNTKKQGRSSWRSSISL